MDNPKFLTIITLKVYAMKNLSNIQFAQQPSADQTLGNFKDFTLEVCLNDASLNTAFQLRYRAYLAVDAIPENEEGLLYDQYDFLPNARVFLVWYQGKPVATVRSCIYSEAYNWMKTEAVKYFQEDIVRQLGAQTNLLESNRFAVDPDFQGRQSLFARFLLFRAHGLNAAAHQCKYIMTSVRANHIAFYRRFLALNPVSKESCYVEWADAEVALLANKTEECLGAILKRGMPDYDLEDVRQYVMCAHIPFIDHQRNVA